MQQSERKYKHLSLKHQIFKENNNNYKKNIECYKGLQRSHITIKYQGNTKYHKNKCNPNLRNQLEPFMKLIKLVQRAQTTVKYQGNKNKFNQNKHKLSNLKKYSKCKKNKPLISSKISNLKC